MILNLIFCSPFKLYIRLVSTMNQLFIQWNDIKLLHRQLIIVKGIFSVQPLKFLNSNRNRNYQLSLQQITLISVYSTEKTWHSCCQSLIGNPIWSLISCAVHWIMKNGACVWMETCRYIVNNSWILILW